MEHITIYATLDRDKKVVTILEAWSDDEQVWINDPWATYFGQNTGTEIYESFDTAEHIRATHEFFADVMSIELEIITN
jgi:hypothetical protein